MRNAYICAGCHKPGHNPPGIPIMRIGRGAYHPSCYIRATKKIICPNCKQEIHEGDGVLIAQGQLPRHSNLNCHLKGK